MKKELGFTELDIMDYIWSENRENILSSEIKDYFVLNKNKKWKKQTVSSYLKKLIKRGFLDVKIESGKHYYSPIISRYEYGEILKQSTLKFLTDDSGSFYCGLEMEKKEIITPDKLLEIKHLFEDLNN